MHITQTNVGGCLLLTLQGELNADAAAEIQLALRKALLDSPDPVVCDLAGIHRYRQSCLMVFPAAYVQSGGWPRVVLALTGATPELRQALIDSGVAQLVPLVARQDLLGGPPFPNLRPELVSRTTGLSTTTRACSEARHEVAEFCKAVGCDGDALDDVRVVASELAANAVIHGRPPVELRLQATTDLIAITVHDSSPELPAPTEPDMDHGRGLAIVAALTSGWSARPIPGDGKAVTARIDRRRAGAQGPSEGSEAPR